MARMLAPMEEDWFAGRGASNMANPVAKRPKGFPRNSPLGFDVDDRTMLLEIYEKICGLTMLVEVARENHRALYGTGAMVDADPPDRTGSPSYAP